MDDTIYLRPRERLRDYGPTTLSDIELIQVILGSGSITSSVAKIARQVQELFSHRPITYEGLIAISGIGRAKACQILAALELSKRL